MGQETIANRMFDGAHAEAHLEGELFEAGVEDFERLSFDSYDCSLEIYGLAEGFRLSSKAQKVIYDAGFAKVYCNHVDKWETHYSWPKEFKEADGWRVSYPQKRGKDETSILVEKHIPGWPQDWFSSGYVKIKTGTDLTRE